MSPSSLPAETTQSLDQARSLVDEALDRYTAFADTADSLGHFCPQELREAMRYSLLAPGKRLRPVLALLSAGACGRPAEVALPAACAVEMVHAYSLIHDDLPAMDDDDLRRGKPSCHKVYGEATAILAGDALLARAFEVLASDAPPAVAARCCATLGKIAGAVALVGGQFDDLAAEPASDDSPDAKAQHLQAIHARKTAAMLWASLHLGGLCAEASEPQLTALGDFGQNLGLAFQITDDLLDVGGDEATLGKQVGKDSDRGKLTFPGLFGVEESRRRAVDLIDRAIAALAPLAPHAESLEALARYVVERDR